LLLRKAIKQRFPYGGLWRSTGPRGIHCWSAIYLEKIDKNYGDPHIDVNHRKFEISDHGDARVQANSVVVVKVTEEEDSSI
jgi:hypothetical protein